MTYLARIVRLADGTFEARFDAFGDLRVAGATEAEVRARAPGELYAHIDMLQSQHEPVISATRVAFEEP